MKKLTAIEAANVVGGTCKTCETTYQNVTIGGVTSCKAVTTCTDKHGTTMSLRDADTSKCGGVPNR
ncbi:DUF4762 family protein [Citrobacter rodentium]|jgi:hypothetical protein|uniref:DUF4762 domain-containing protein n=2 Tax=Citrobacter rodentium TaxID=67825 RepID=D2TQT1_CITRI|nr:DUF4762 family protein [Citrobacter rodentium]KIQ49790.1 hypothetical protein TA05_19235 [Citrobacter rodentium]QBY29871.1 DUF4762 domain-containing protein [Citrobacter rodentium]UHO32740.1 DUF4762 domain-containing protein [Citrobacter rodentium NBRC 105723 = DSM 16636]CBG90217.1 hypothetical protein ROD_35041 [Citrobacter rodentium ICC168]HAT8014190.1 DUF4762 domain-containing protein [Citrobacter rodentium NBRC 105723 = DSM 16636]